MALDRTSFHAALLMAAPCVKPPLLYKPRDPRTSDLWRLIDEHFETFRQVYDERYQTKYGYWRPVVEKSVAAFLKCGDLEEGFARVRCPDCRHEMFVAFSCKQRCTCPSCHQKRTLLTAIHVAEDVCFPVAHRQVVFTIPKRLRVHARFDRKLLGKLSRCAWECIKAEVRRLLGRRPSLRDGARVVPGMIAAIQTFGQLLHWNPHLHCLKDACQAFPDPRRDDLASGPNRNFQILSPLDLLAEFTQHIPPKGVHLIRYYGIYSKKTRGMRKKAAAEEPADPVSPSATLTATSAGCGPTWAMLIKRVYETNPLTCPRCGSEMAIVSFIEPPQKEVIDRILEHCGLRRSPEARPPPDADGAARELDYVDIDTFLATF